MTQPSDGTPRHPIRVVARRTGLSPSLLRAWERRYGVVEPARSDGGQRLYSDADVRRLTMLATAIDAGRRISRVAGLTDAELAALISEDGYARPATPPLDADTARTADRILAASLASVEQFEGSRLEGELMQAAVLLHPESLIDDVLLPLLQRIGALWEHGVVGPATEHAASVTVRKFLDWLLGASDVRADAPVLVCGTPAGHRHEFGALIAAVSGAYAGWRTTFLGADLPAEEIATAARRVGADVIALSAVFPIDDADLPGEVARLVALAPPGSRVLLGGAAALHLRDRLEECGAVVLDSLGELRERLSRSSKTSG